MEFLKSKYASTVGLMIALTVTTLAMVAQAPMHCASAHASDTLPSDYCISIEVDVTNNTGSTLTNYPVRAELTALALQGNDVLDSRGWDVVAGIGSINSEVFLVEQDLDVNDAAWWIVMPSLADGETQTVTLWMGNGEARRDQGMFFSGNEVVTVAGDAAINGTVELLVQWDMYLTDDTPRNETILEKGSYSVDLIDNAGTLEIRWDVAGSGSDCQVPWNAAWTNTWTNFNFGHTAGIGAFTDMYVNGSIVDICNPPGSGGVGAGTGDLTIGQGLLDNLSNAYIRDLRMRCCSLGSSDLGNEILPDQRALHLTFDANKMSENISSTLPFQGTIDDMGLNDINTTYTINSSQTNIDVVVNSPTLTSLTVGAVVDEDLVDLTGQVLPDDIFDPVIKDTSSPFYTYVIQPLENVFPQDWQGPTLAMFAIGIAAGLWIAQKTEWEYPILYLVIIGMLPGFGAYNGWVPWPFVLLWSMVVFFQWTGMIRMIKEAF